MKNFVYILVFAILFLSYSPSFATVSPMKVIKPGMTFAQVKQIMKKYNLRFTSEKEFYPEEGDAMIEDTRVIFSKRKGILFVSELCEFVCRADYKRFHSDEIISWYNACESEARKFAGARCHPVKIIEKQNNMGEFTWSPILVHGEWGKFEFNSVLGETIIKSYISDDGTRLSVVTAIDGTASQWFVHTFKRKSTGRKKQNGNQFYFQCTEKDWPSL